MGLTNEQRAEMGRLLPRDAVQERRVGRDVVRYLPGWYVIAAANRIFGADGWSYRLLELQQVAEATKANGNALGAFQATVEVTIGGCIRQDVGLDAYDCPVEALISGVDKARKGAVTDALKRALRTFGDQFGLSLYDRHGALGLSHSAEQALAQVDELADDASAVAWWRDRRDAIADLDQDEQEAVKSAFARRRQSLVESLPVAAAPPTAPPVVPLEASTTSFAPPPRAPATTTSKPAAKSTASAAIADMAAAKTVETLRKIPRMVAVSSLSTEERAELNACYLEHLRRLDVSAWWLYRAQAAKKASSGEAMAAELEEALREDQIAPETYDRAVAILGAR
jgi:DNA recombination protein Rad52